MNVSRDFLYKSTSSGVVIDESEFEFAEYICESMVSLGSSNLQCIIGDSTILSHYLQQVMCLSSLLPYISNALIVIYGSSNKVEEKQKIINWVVSGHPFICIVI